MRVWPLLLVLTTCAWSQVARSARAAADFPLSTEPDAPVWKSAPAIVTTDDPLGKTVAGHRTEIRSRWTADSLYFLFICPFEAPYMKPQPVTSTETDKLWNWDVAEVFIGWDFNNIYRYKEFEISPHGEWVDLDIDRKHPASDGGVGWNSGFTSAARIDESKRVWYGVMRIPWKSIAQKTPSPRDKFRVNFYRMQGPPPDRKMLAWRPTGAKNYHVPEAFGILELVP